MFRTPHLWTGLQLRRDFRTFVRINFLYAAFESGLLAALRRPASQQELTGQLGVTCGDLLEALLALGVAFLFPWTSPDTRLTSSRAEACFLPKAAGPNPP